MQIPFTKMVGAGNDFIVVDARAHTKGLGVGVLASLQGRWSAISRSLCERRGGIGADGLLVLERSRSADVRMRVFNPDGSEAKMCGNGARCVAAYIKSPVTGHRSPVGREGEITIETRAGVLSARVRGRRVAMRMTDPAGLRLDLSVDVDGRAVRLGFVNTGVPHAVVRVRAIETVDVSRLGQALRAHRYFAPRGTNVDFVQPDPRRPNRLHVRTYERGVERETPACGTGVAASAVVYAVNQWTGGNGRATTRRIEVETRSGDVLTVGLTIVPGSRGACVTDVTLEGPAERVFAGVCEWPLIPRPDGVAKSDRPQRGRAFGAPSGRGMRRT